MQAGYGALTLDRIALFSHLINLRTMRNCGVDYSAGPNGLRLGGAHARHAGRFDVLKYFRPRAAGEA